MATPTRFGLREAYLEYSRAVAGLADTASFDAARAQCAARAAAASGGDARGVGDLVSIRSAAENKEVVALVQAGSSSHADAQAWIGLRDTSGQ